VRLARSRLLPRIAVAVLAIALLGAACSSDDAESVQPTPEPQTLEQYFSGLQALFDTYETRTDAASEQFQNQFSGATDAESAIEQALEVFPQLMAVIQPILGDLVDGLAATNPPDGSRVGSRRPA